MKLIGSEVASSDFVGRRHRRPRQGESLTKGLGRHPGHGESDDGPWRRDAIEESVRDLSTDESARAMRFVMRSLHQLAANVPIQLRIHFRHTEDRKSPGQATHKTPMWRKINTSLPLATRKWV